VIDVASHAPTSRRAGVALLPALGVVLVAANLRPAASTVGPLVDQIRDDLSLSATAAGILLTLPVLCFGALGPLAPALGRRVGYARTAAVALCILITGLLMRLLPGVAPLYVSAALAGTAIAVGNVSLPVLVRQKFPERTGLMTGVFMTSLVGMAALASGVVVPLSHLFDSWRGALAVWAVPALIALVVWLVVNRGRESEPSGRPQHARVRPLLRDPLAWQVTAFFGLQSMGFFITLSWLPTIFESHGIGSTEAGILLGVCMVVGLPLALTVPSYAARLSHQRWLVVACTSCIALGFTGLLVAPVGGAWVWAALIGAGQNAAFPIAQIMIQLRSPSVHMTAGLSTMAQSIGYLIAATGPLGMGALHDATGSWTPAVVVLLALLVPQTLVGLGAARDRHVVDAG
jgi:CP family cyanate transporter-like MFS transporter